MLSGLTDLLAATAVFVLGHLALSSQPLRTPLVPAALRADLQAQAAAGP
jgi:hypothetical protein